MNNYWHTNYKPGQGGDHEFRFSFTSRDTADNAESAHFGWAASNPLLAVATDENTSGALPATSGSLIQITNPNVLLIGAKKADRGEGMILRLWEVSGRSTTTRVRLNHFSATKATACNLSEDPHENLSVEDGTIPVPIRGFGLATIRLDR
jgi:alpha-mannosidase